MKRFFPVYVRVPLLFAIFFGFVEYFVDSGDKPAFIEYPSVLLLLGLFLFVQIAVEIVSSSVNKVVKALMTPEERAEKERLDDLPLTETPGYKKLMKALTRSKSEEEEPNLVLDHEYDGIKELDNDLPPWWVYLFYATIIFGVIYLAKYQLFGGDNQVQELDKEMAAAKIQIEEYKKTAPDLLTADQVTLLTDPADLAAGKKIYDTNCVACHKADGGGSIGPNLTDEYWILGGDVKDVFNTIMEGGRDGKGMVPWKAQIKPSEIQKVASYILSLQGTNPPEAKAPEGDLFTPTQTNTTEVATDTLQSPAAEVAQN